MANILIDLRQTIRSLLRDRSFTGLAVLMLAVGIAGSATIFSVLDAALLRPLPLPEPARLVTVWERTPEGADFVTSEPNFLDFRAQSRSFAALGAYREQAVDRSGQGEPERLRGAAVSASLFQALGVQPQLGRTFTESEDAVGSGARVVVISDAFWRRLGASRSVLSQSIVLNGTAHSVIGVMPPAFQFPRVDVWMPLRANPAGDRGNHWLTMVGRLREGTTAAAAQDDLAAIAQRIGNVYAGARGWSVRLESFHLSIVGTGMRSALWTLMVSVLLLLVLTCANITSLFITRVHGRSEELAVRAALGAGRRRLVLHVLLEAVLLAGAGTVLALFITVWALDGVRSLAPERFPVLENVRADLRLIGFTSVVSLISALAFSLTLALRAGSAELSSLLKSRTRAVGRRESQRTRELLLVAQVALATVLLLGSGLVLRSLLALERVDPGFRADGLLAVPIELTGSQYQREDWRISVFFQRLATRVAAIPGVSAAGASTTDPFRPMHFVNDVTPVERAAEVGPAGLLQADWRVVTRGYFETARVSLLQGRLFEESDRFDAPRVAVITAAMARQLWPQQNAVGRAFYWGGIGDNPITVIGVVADIRDFELAIDAPPLLFLPTTQMSMPMMSLLVRADAPDAALTRAIREAVWAIDPTVPVPSIRPVSENRSLLLAQPRLQTMLLTSFALLALLVAALGVYALVAYHVTSRVRELGIRFALGAQPRELTGLILRRTALLVSAGLLLGFLLTAPLTAAVRALLFQTRPLDPATFLAAAVVLITSSLVAAWLPARRIARMDPLRALQTD